MNKRSVKTKNPIAYESPDYLNPWGTRRDLSRQIRYEAKLHRYMEHKCFNKILDMGCSGGAYISNMHDLGFFAIGLEGSDFSKANKRGPWAYLSDFVLHTCDITKPFEVLLNDNERVAFDIITSFEVLEHLTNEQLDGLFDNIAKHSHDHTKLILSISTCDDFINGINLHQTVHNKNWWLNRFDNLGWECCDNSIKYFNKQYLRGNRFGAKESFEVVLKKKGVLDTNVPRLSVKDWIFDANNGSIFQRILYKFVHGDKVYNSY